MNTPLAYVSLDPAMLRDGTEHTRVVFVRHGQPEGTPAGVLPQAWLDAELTETGLKQAVVVAEHLEGETLTAVACSNLRRAVQTAEEIAARHSLELTVRPALAEIDLYTEVPLDVWPGDHVGQQAWAAAHDRFARDRRWDVFGFGETGAQLRARVVGAVQALVDSHPGGTVAVVCHGGAINAYLGYLLGIEADMFFLPAHASVTVVLAAADGRRVVECLNERHHLDAAGLLTY